MITPSSVAHAVTCAQIAHRKQSYVQITRHLEKIHCLFLEALKNRLSGRDIHHITPHQALIIYHIGEQEVTVHELAQKGYYNGANISYNLRKLASTGLLEYQKQPQDRRHTHVRLSPKGRRLWQLCDAMLHHSAQAMPSFLISQGDLDALTALLRKCHLFLLAQVQQLQDHPPQPQDEGN